MKRDDDLIRKLLLECEASEEWLFPMPGLLIDSSKDEEIKRYHLLLLSDAGFLTKPASGTFRLTAQGHDFLDAIRSEDIWKKTKDGAAKIGGMTLDILKAVAIELFKQKVAEELGIPL